MDSAGPAHGIPPYELLVRGVLEIYKTIRDIAVALDYPPQLNDVTLLLKTLYTLAAGYREIKFKLSRKLPPWQ